VSKKARRNFTADQKAAIVRRHVFDKVPVSNLCDEYGIRRIHFEEIKITEMDLKSFRQNALGSNGRTYSALPDSNAIC
jgi:hypothetical protein